MEASHTFIHPIGLLVLALAGGVICLDPHYSGPHVVVRGQTFTIECRLTPFDFPKWTKDGIPLDKNSEDYDMTDGETSAYEVNLKLTVRSARPEHSGEYRCNSFSRKSHRISLQGEMPEVDPGKKAKSKVLTVNETIKIHCDLPINIAFQIFWFKNYVRLYPGKDPNVEIRGNALVIHRPQESDAGQYMCTKTDVKSLSKPAVSSPGDVIGDITIVKLPSRVEDFPHEMSLMEGTDLTLECKVQGAPIPKVTWFIGNVPAVDLEDEDERLHLIPNEDGLPNAVLKLLNVSFDDRNLYTCQAENSLNVDESSVFITVREGMIQTNANESYGGVLLEKDKPLELQCNLTGHETVEEGSFEIKWKKGGVNLDDGPVYKIFPNNYTLVVETPKEGEHTGFYTCTLSKGEEVYNATIYVQARAYVTPFSRSMNLVQGDPLPLKCFFGGVPTPTIHWYKDDVFVNETDPRVNISLGMEEGTNKMYSLLRIENLDFDDRGEYKCEAQNGLNEEGSVNTTITVRVKDKLAALWPFLGICVEVAILCTIIFVYEKKRVKPDFEESDAEHNTEHKNVHDNKEGTQDVRQRK